MLAVKGRANLAATKFRGIAGKPPLPVLNRAKLSCGVFGSGVDNESTRARLRADQEYGSSHPGHSRMAPALQFKGDPNPLSNNSFCLSVSLSLSLTLKHPTMRIEGMARMLSLRGARKR
jgi:hypothetical protein